MFLAKLPFYFLAFILVCAIVLIWQAVSYLRKDFRNNGVVAEKISKSMLLVFFTALIFPIFFYQTLYSSLFFSVNTEPYVNPISCGYEERTGFQIVKCNPAKDPKKWDRRRFGFARLVSRNAELAERISLVRDRARLNRDRLWHYRNTSRNLFLVMNFMIIELLLIYVIFFRARDETLPGPEPVKGLLNGATKLFGNTSSIVAFVAIFLILTQSFAFHTKFAASHKGARQYAALLAEIEIRSVNFYMTMQKISPDIQESSQKDLVQWEKFDEIIKSWTDETRRIENEYGETFGSSFSPLVIEAL